MTRSSQVIRSAYESGGPDYPSLISRFANYEIRRTNLYQLESHKPNLLADCPKLFLANTQQSEEAIPH